MTPRTRSDGPPLPGATPQGDAIAHLRARAGGPLPLRAGAAAPAGMLRLTRPDATGEALPVWPDGVTPSLLDEYQVAPVAVERSGETRRVLAAVLKCCWADLTVDPWPGEPAPVELVLDTYRALIGRPDDLMRNWAVGALRRLHDSAWVVMSDGLVTLGARCALWPVESHAQLKEVVRRIPEPERPELTVVADADIIAARTASTPAETARRAPALTAPDSGPLGDAAAPAGRAEETDGPSGGRAGPLDAAVVPGGRVEGGGAEFDDLLDGYDERRRAELVAAFMVVEHAAEPVQEARFGALRDPALRHTLGEMLARRGRTLIQHRERWISGYADQAAVWLRAARADAWGAGGPDLGGEPGSDDLASAPEPGDSEPGDPPPGDRLGEGERAVLTLVLVHSVAIPRAEGVLPEDTWLSPHPTPVDELRRHTQLPIGELEAALRVLRHAGLLAQVKAGEEAGGYVPGPQFHRLTPAARRRLQEELILAAGPHTPLAAAVRARRSAG